MMRVYALAAVLGCAAAGTFDAAGAVPAGWAATNDLVPAHMKFRVSVGLKRSNVAWLNRVVEEVSDPSHAEYLQYPSYEEIGSKVRPSAEHTATVRKWLSEHGVQVTSEHPHGDYFHAEATVAQLEAMTASRFVMYAHTSGLRAARITSGISLPSDVAEAVDTFSGFQTLPRTTPDYRPSARRNATDAPAGHVTPDVFMKNYGMTKVPKSGKRNIQAIAQFQGQFVDKEDLNQFCKRYSDSGCQIAKYVGHNEDQPGIESMLDTEYIMPVGGHTETWVYSYPSMDFCGDLLAFGSNVTGEAVHPFSISVSYGSQFIGFCSTSSMNRFAQDVVKMSAMGITLMISSGDDGSGGMTRQGRNPDHKLAPSYPASVPHAVAVGATYWLKGASGPEEASTTFGSGGGFSWDFDMPSYQTAAAAEYLKTVTLPHAKYQTTGRASPDVSALGESFTIIDGGEETAVDGTSASSPSMGGIVSQLNEACLAASGKTLGFFNPLMYSNPQMFTDVVHGTNAIDYNKEGWAAIKGWDAATGLGVPNFPKMLEVVKQACAKARKN